MCRHLLVALLLAGMCLLVRVSYAQEQPAAGAAAERLLSQARQHLVLQDTLLAFPTRRMLNGRFDVEEAVVRAAYRIETPVDAALAPEAAARAYVQFAAADYGWSEDMRDLQVAAAQVGRYNSHVLFQQTFYGIPVYHRQVKVSLDRAGQPSMVVSTYATHLSRVQRFDATPRLSAQEATERVRQLAATGVLRTSVPELFVYPSKAPRLVWHLLAWPVGAAAEWEVLLDAHTGEVVQLIDQSTHVRSSGALRNESSPAAPTRGRATAQPAAGAPPRSASATGSRLNGSGLVFAPDPLTTSGRTYAPPYVDQDDADLPELNAERKEVSLFDITRSNDGLYRLEGPYVQIVGDDLIGGTVYDPPAEAEPGAFRYTRADDAFEAVMAYYHIDLSQRYVQSLDIGRSIQDVPVRVNPHGLGPVDDSKYYLGLNAIAFGTGGIDDAEDADVIWHEYGHALLEGATPGLRSTFEGRAFHEGWSDFWAASYSRALEEEGRVPASGKWRQLYTWDGNSGCWQGRLLDHDGHYPDDVWVAAEPGCPAMGDIYQWGVLWATTLMEIYDDLGRTVTNRLSLVSLGYLLPSDAVFRDAAEALIQADLDLYGGVHVGTLLEHLGARGFVDPDGWGPVVDHEPLASTEQVAGTVPIEVRATGTISPVDSVLVFYGVEGQVPTMRLVLRQEGADRYTGELQLPPQAGTISYYVEVSDEAGQRTRLPLRAPLDVLHFNVGPDMEPPRIQHAPISRAVLGAWPVEVAATVEDALGIDTVWVDFSALAPGGSQVLKGSFGLQYDSGYYRGTFPVAGSLLEEGSQVQYRIHAQDAARARNKALLPEQGGFAFSVFTEGALLAYDFEGSDQEGTAKGVWARETPAYGLKVAHSGTRVWATSAAAAYQDSPQRSSLAFPPLRNLERLEQVYLVFWHWYDMEHDGHAEPGRSEAILWDGGNIKVSTDVGASWQVLTPEGGYSGIISGTGNPLEGEPAFGGYSYGWRQEVIPLPRAEEVRIRFDFGTDEGNTGEGLYFAGWFLDDVSVTTERPQDEEAPVALLLPPELVMQDAGTAPPLISVRLRDETGISSATAEYVAYDADDHERGLGRVRLAMAAENLESFSGAFNMVEPLGAGGRIEYRIRAVDFAGNEQVYPSPGETAFRIEYRLTKKTDMLRRVHASGLWQQAGVGWSVTSGASHEESSLVLEPFDLPDNASELNLMLEHRYNLPEGLGGNVKVSLDDGRNWAILPATGGYDAVFAPGTAHAMEGEEVFTGSSGELASTVFDLSPYSGRQVRLRVDFGSTRALDAGEFWTIQQAKLSFATRADAFEIPRELTLHANFPDPFATVTNISYTLPEAMPVRLEVYDLQGRRVAVLIQDELAEGTYTTSFDGSGLASGVYLLRMIAGGAQRIERMVVAR